MNHEIAISVENVSKHFRLPHEKVSSIRGAFVSMLRRKSYEDFYALQDISFQVKKGEFFSIIGKNGSGKSTLLSSIAGILTPDTGVITVNGEISPFLALGIGFNGSLSGRDNILLNGTILGMTKKELAEKFDSIVDFAEVRRFIDQKVGNYSSGMSSRLAFSVAIHAERDIYLMDEVLAVGDEAFREKCLDVFADLMKRGKTIIFVSHSMELIREYSDNALVLIDGVSHGVFEPGAAIEKYQSLL